MTRSINSGKDAVSFDVDVVISNMTITPKRNTQVAFVGPYITVNKRFITLLSMQSGV